MGKQGKLSEVSIGAELGQYFDTANSERLWMKQRQAALPHSTCQRRGLELYQTQQSTSLTQTASRGLGGACIRCESLETHLADADNEVSGQVHTGLERTDKLHEELSFAMCEQGDSLNCVTIPAMHAQR